MHILPFSDFEPLPFYNHVHIPASHQSGGETGTTVYIQICCQNVSQQCSKSEALFNVGIELKLVLMSSRTG